MQLISDRLEILPLDKHHLESLFSYRSDKETNQFQGWIPDKIEDCYDFLEQKVAKEINIPDTWFQCAIVKKDNKELIGDIGIHFKTDGNQVEFGITLAKIHHAKGYASEALSALIDYLFGKLNKHRIIASIDPRNHASEKLLKQLNFRKEAHFIESIYFKEEWVDDIIYAILRKEWIIQA